MKQNFLKITKFMAICALLVLNSCEKDLYDEGLKSQNHIKKINIEQKSFNELMFTKKFNEAYRKIEKAKNKFLISGNNKTTLEENYNFTIVTSSPVKVITEESENQTTYIMLI